MHDPFLLPGGEHGCLIVHGFSGSPAETRELGGHLAAQGLTVYGLRLPGHGGHPDELAAATLADWRAAVSYGYQLLRRRCARVSLVGFSLGGALCTMLAAEQPAHRLVLLATPTHLGGGWQVNAVGLLALVMPHFYPLARADFSDAAVRAQVLRRAPDLDLDDQQVQERLRREVRLGLRAIDEARRAFLAGRRALPRVRAPALVMQGRADVVAPDSSPLTIAAELGSPRRSLALWEDTGHELLGPGPHQRAIFGRVAQFVGTGS